MKNTADYINVKISQILKHADYLKNFAVKDPNEVARYYAYKEMKSFIEMDFMTRNPDEMIDDYAEYFGKKHLLSRTVNAGDVFYRARVGYETLYGSEGDHNRSFIVPYHQSGILAPPPLFTKGARFNKAGTSCLYLANNVETCVAEVHLQVGQICSVGKFVCKENTEFIDLTNRQKDLELEIWIDILTQPIYTENENRYNITNFISGVLKRFNANGLYFESVQSTGDNIVCYKPNLFELEEYSEKTFRATKVKYEIEPFHDSIEEFSNRKSHDSLLAINDDLDEKHEQEFERLDTWIDIRKKDKSLA